MNCTNCGQPIEPNSAFCSACGARIHTAGSAQYQQAQAYPEQKSKLAAGLLQLLLGLGIGRLYLGYTSIGILQLVLTLCCGVGAVWCLIDGIMILTGSVTTDANGIPLKD